MMAISPLISLNREEIVSHMKHTIEKLLCMFKKGNCVPGPIQDIHKQEWKLKHTTCELCVHINSAQPCVQNIIKCRTTDIYCTTVKKKKK